MSNKPRPGRRHRSVPLQAEHWFPGEIVAGEVGTTRTAVIEQMFKWWLRVPGAELPERPPPELIERVFAQWHRQQGECVNGPSGGGGEP